MTDFICTIKTKTKGSKDRIKRKRNNNKSLGK